MGSKTEKVVKHLEFQTIPQTRRYFWKQRTILFGFFAYNMLKPYAAAIIPLFVLAGNHAASLEAIFFGFIFVFAVFVWIMMKYIPHRYPQECGRYIVDYNAQPGSSPNSLQLDQRDFSLSHGAGGQQLSDMQQQRSISAASAATIQSLQTAGKRISSPSLLKCMCFIEGWRECGMIRTLTSLILFGYSIFLFYYYVGIMCGFIPDSDRSTLQKKVSISTLIVLYISFFATLRTIYLYESSFCEEMVSNPTIAENYFDQEFAKESVQLRLRKEQEKIKKELEKERMKKLKAKAKAKKSDKQSSDLEGGHGHGSNQCISNVHLPESNFAFLLAQSSPFLSLPNH
jgi:hypothetical protein